MLCLVLSARKRSQCLTLVRMSGSPLSPKFPAVALQRSKSSASVHSGGALRHLELAPSIYTIYLSNSQNNKMSSLFSGTSFQHHRKWAESDEFDQSNARITQ